VSVCDSDPGDAGIYEQFVPVMSLLSSDARKETMMGHQ